MLIVLMVLCQVSSLCSLNAEHTRGTLEVLQKVMLQTYHKLKVPSLVRCLRQVFEAKLTGSNEWIARVCAYTVRVT